MNAKSRKWDIKTILLGLIIAVIIIAVVFVIFVPPSEEGNTLDTLTVQELWQNRDTYVGERVAVEGFYYLSVDGSPSLVPATTVSNPNPSIWIDLNATSLNSVKQAANITISSNLKYRVVGVYEEITSEIGLSVFKIKVESIEAV